MNGVERGRRGIHILYEPSGGLGCCGGKHFHLDVVNRVGTVATVTPTVDGPVTSLPLSHGSVVLEAWANSGRYLHIHVQDTPTVYFLGIWSCL